MHQLQPHASSPTNGHAMPSVSEPTPSPSPPPPQPQPQRTSSSSSTSYHDVKDVVGPMIAQCHHLHGNLSRRPSAPPVPPQAPSTTAKLRMAAFNPDLLQRITSLGFFGHTLHVPPHPPSPPPSDDATSDAAPAAPTAVFAASPAPLPRDPGAPLAVRCEVRTRIPSEWGGEPALLLYSNTRDAEEHLAIVYGMARSASLDRVVEGDTDAARAVRGARPVAVAEAAEADRLGQAWDAAEGEEPPLARIHSCCFTGETLGSVRCDCREQLQEAMRLMAIEGRGVILYLKQEGRGIGLKEKLRAYNLIDQGYDTMEANVLLGHPPDARGYEIASAILRDLGIASVRLLTNNPDKLASVQRGGVTVAERVPMVPASWTSGEWTSPALGVGTVAAAETSPPLEPERHASAVSLPSLAASPLLARPSLQDRDEYLVAKVQRMGHILDIPAHVLSAVSAKGKTVSSASLGGAGEGAA
ncbi:GTP cyclohydrolase II [Phlyctochytrium bullatum]|nr:GTP cyclohydrolase II [Phlyctochytrium bullatum]